MTPKYFYPRPPRGGRPGSFLASSRTFSISIHALREEGDEQQAAQGSCGHQFLSTPSARRATCLQACWRCGLCYFYPRPPRGGRPSAAGQHAEPDRFLSTPSARRATDFSKHGFSSLFDFYPRPPRGGRRVRHRYYQRRECISIHALREEGDGTTNGSGSKEFVFLSTPSARRATRRGGCLFQLHGFLSTPSARRATQQPERMGDRHQISIHALREEGDRGRKG